MKVRENVGIRSRNPADILQGMDGCLHEHEGGKCRSFSILIAAVISEVCAESKRSALRYSPMSVANCDFDFKFQLW